MNEDITRLPKWAQERIKQLEMQRNAAVRALNEFQDSKTKSRVWVENYVCTGELTGPCEKKYYLQTRLGPCEKKYYLQTRSVFFQVGGSEVHIYLRGDGVLDINAAANLWFRPWSSNVIRIEEV